MKELCSFNHKAGYLSVHLRDNGVFDLLFFEWDELNKKHRQGVMMHGTWSERRKVLTLGAEFGVLEYRRVKGPLTIGSQVLKTPQYVLEKVAWVEGAAQPWWVFDGQGLALIDRDNLNKSMKKAGKAHAAGRKWGKIFMVVLALGLLALVAAYWADWDF